MSKITLNNVTTFTNDSTAVATVNNNSNAIQTAFENTLSRDGTAPNQMAADLDMNSNRIINLPEPISLSEPLRLQDAQTLNGTGTITVGNVPNGGTTGQVLSKTSNADQATGWSSPHYVPPGGTAGQYLIKNTSTDYDTIWNTLPSSGIPNTALILTTLASLSTTTVSGSISSIQFLGYDTQGDTVPFIFKRVSSPLPFNLGCKQSQDGAWWQYVPPASGIDTKVFGAKADWDNTNTQLSSGGGDTNATDNATPIQNAINFAYCQFNPGYDSGGGMSGIVLLPRGTCMVGSTLQIHDGINLKGTGLYSSVLKMKGTFDPSRNFINIGTQEAVDYVSLSQSRASAGNLLINGTGTSGGVAYLLSKRLVGVYSSGNDTGITFTIHGTDGDGQPMVSTFTGGNGTFATQGAFFLTVESVSCSGATAGNVTVGTQIIASFASRLEDTQLWSNHQNALAGTAMVYSSNTQHTGGICRCQISAGNRSAIRFDGGVGGASTMTFEDINCGNYGDFGTAASNNPCIYVRWLGLNFPMKRIVIGGNPLNGPNAVGLKIDGGQVNIKDIHVETYNTAIQLNNSSINNGMITICGCIGSGSMTDLIQITAAATTEAHVAYQNVMPNGATNTVNDKRSGGTASGSINVLQWTYK